MNGDEYHKLPGVSNTQVSDFIKDPRLYWYKWLSGHYVQPRRDEFDFGIGVHAMVLLGDESGIVQIPDSVLSKNGAKAGNAWIEFAANNADKILLKPQEYKRLRECVNAVLYHPAASALLSCVGESEVMHQYDDHDLGLRLRCKPDRLVTTKSGETIVLDLKTTTAVGAREFANSVASYGYHRQEYFYRKVLQANGHEVSRFVFITVTKEEPFLVDCYSLSEEFLRIGQTQVENALFEIAERTRSNNWLPKNHGKIVPIDPPNYLKYVEEYAL